MNAFDKKLNEYGEYPLKAKSISAIEVFMGPKCNMRCTHCHQEGGPDRNEEATLETLEKFLHVLRQNPAIHTINLFGGSAEMNPHFRYFAKSAADMGRQVMLASNLTVFFEPGFEDIPEFLAGHRVMINASLPHYMGDEVDRVRGNGAYKKSISALKILNRLGYGREGSNLTLNLLYNPPEAKMPPEAKALEMVFREKLQEMHGIVFNNLFTINNMPIGRFAKRLSRERLNDYMKELEHNFNPATVENMMCRTSVAFSLDGKKTYDCDYWRVLDIPVKAANSGLDSFNYGELISREIVTQPLCLVCTAGAGVSCSELLV
ncbi:MAG: arsenosugar biosynthesis radical SAM (seleno)protein ArsS [Nitrospirota bacterium]